MQQTLFPFETPTPKTPPPPLSPEQLRRLVELMAQAIEAVSRHDQGGGHER